MAITPIGITNDYEPVAQEQTADLVCPLSGQKEPMTLTFYCKETKTFFGKRIGKYPLGVFSRTSDGEEVSPDEWTPEMSRFSEQAADNVHIPHAGKIRLSFAGKAYIALICGLVILGAVAAVMAMRDKNAGSGALDQFEARPQAGDLYFGSFNIFGNGGAPQTGYAWMRVASAEGQDGTCQIQLSDDVSDAYKRSGDMRHDTFGDAVFNVKFNVPSDARGRVEFRGENFVFVSTLVGSDVKSAKKTGGR